MPRRREYIRRENDSTGSESAHRGKFGSCRAHYVRRQSADNPGRNPRSRFRRSSSSSLSNACPQFAQIVSALATPLWISRMRRPWRQPGLRSSIRISHTFIAQVTPKDLMSRRASEVVNFVDPVDDVVRGRGPDELCVVSGVGSSCRGRSRAR
jgi:hypothetical protein